MTIKELTENFKGDILLNRKVEGSLTEEIELVCRFSGNSILLNYIGDFEVIEWEAVRHGTKADIHVLADFPDTTTPGENDTEDTEGKPDDETNTEP